MLNQEPSWSATWYIMRSIPGWSRETVGSHIVRRNRIFNCGQTGIVGHLGGIFSLIEGNEIHHINTYGEFSGSELGGLSCTVRLTQ